MLIVPIDSGLVRFLSIDEPSFYATLSSLVIQLEQLVRCVCVCLCLDNSSTTVAHEVRRACFLSCRFCHLERTADNVRTVADPVEFRKLLKPHYFIIAFSVC